MGAQKRRTWAPVMLVVSQDLTSQRGLRRYPLPTRYPHGRGRPPSVPSRPSQSRQAERDSLGDEGESL